MVKVINRESLKEINKKKNKVDVIRIYKGTAEQNLKSNTAETFKFKVNDETSTEGKFKELESIRVKHNGDYVGSEGHAKLWNEIEELKAKYDSEKKSNAAQNPSQATVEALLGKLFIDVTRRAQEAGDLTSLIATEISDPNASETVNTRWLYKYIGKMSNIAGTNDSVNLIEQKTGATDSFDLVIPAVGWKDSLANVLYNRLHDMEKVNQAAADADVDNRNAAIIGTIVGATYVASQKQAADATSDASWDVLMYNTIRKGIKKLRGLKDPQTGRKIVVPQISILCNSADSWDIERVVNGQLEGSNGTIAVKNLQALPVANIIEYDQGITDGYTYGKETLSFPGVTAGKCYLFVPKEYLWVVNKRPLTLQTGTGETLQLSTEEKAWYRCYGAYFKDFLGSSFPATTLGAGFGSIIEVTLPIDA